jgi:predicted ABC-type ATPase
MPLMEFAEFDRRPILVAIAGPNGAGKTTFFHTHLAWAGLRFVNADLVAAELATEPYEAARLADALRRELVAHGESFAFETVFLRSRGR